MTYLRAQTCEACASKGGLPQGLSKETVDLFKSDLCPLWKIINSPSDDQGQALSRSFTCKNFAVAMSYLTRAGEIAEAEGHHPDLHITSYRTVTTVVYTHSNGGLCKNDFVLAAKLDSLDIDFSPKFFFIFIL